LTKELEGRVLLRNLASVVDKLARVYMRAGTKKNRPARREKGGKNYRKRALFEETFSLLLVGKREAGDGWFVRKEKGATCDGV